jgi:hypothetical protein
VVVAYMPRPDWRAALHRAVEEAMIDQVAAGWRHDQGRMVVQRDRLATMCQ